MSPPAALWAAGLAVGHDGRAVVDGLALELLPGETLAVLGTNGSGKSTLVTTIVGLRPPVAGELRVLGGPPGGAPARVAYLGQTTGSGLALPIRARDVVAMGRFAARGLLGRMRAADRLAIDRGMERMGVAHLAEAPVADLSGGQRQRVHIAQALAWQADLLVLDEPTAGLDVAGRALLLAALDEERARGAAVVMCTHDVRDATAAERCLLLAGRVVAYGAPGEAMTRDALMDTFGLVLGEAPGGGGELVMDPVHRCDDGHGHAP
ncbi:metal ABC transporter ATP-binding protein [Miltoncostaea marina]|uniref:metal ABC transporter ATP-binding protein n=1 Tax=Miltoncostaea marina TaxID=2843215 RepID=UPI001C3D5247|nr:metal ABC transporter ATP-binding protein [Miltoncostaea marina]